METRDDRGPGAEPEPTPGLTTKGDRYLDRKIDDMRAYMNEIAKVVTALPAGVDQKIEPLNTRLDALDQAIDSFAKLAEDVQKIREEFTGFRGFREHVEGLEKSAK